MPKLFAYFRPTGFVSANNVDTLRMQIVESPSDIRALAATFDSFERNESSFQLRTRPGLIYARPIATTSIVNELCNGLVMFGQGFAEFT